MDGHLLEPFLRACFSTNGLHTPKLLSYNKCIKFSLPALVAAENPIIVHIPANKIKLKAKRDGVAHDEWHVLELFNLTFNKPIYTEQDFVTHTILPKECRLRGLTSQATSFVHVQYRTFVVREDVVKLPESMNPANLKLADLSQKAYFTCNSLQQFPNVPFMNIPVMDRSILCHSAEKGRDMQEMGECIMDPGATFIVNGGERLLMYRERPPFNTAFCQLTTKSPSDSHQIEYRADYPGNFKSTATLYIPLTRETRIMPPVLHATISRIKKSKAATATATSAAIQVISIVTWIRALGVLICGQDIYNMFKMVAGDRWNTNKFYQTILVDTLAQSNRHLADMAQEIMTSSKAFEFFDGEQVPKGKLPADSNKYWQKLALMCVGRSSKIMEKNPSTLISLGQFILEQKFLPNMSASYSDGNLSPADAACMKTMSLIQMGCQLIDFLIDKKMTMNKDSYLTKRFDSVDDLISSLLRQLLLIYMKNLKDRIRKTLCSGKIFNVYDLFGGDNRIGKGLCDAIASGAWHATRDNISQTGISQRCTRQNYCDISTLYMVVVNSMVRRSKQAGPRQLDPSSWAILDPNDTPEGETCGLRKYLSIMLLMSLGSSDYPIMRMLGRHLLKKSYGKTDWLFVHNKDSNALLQLCKDTKSPWIHRISIVANGTGTFMIFSRTAEFDALQLGREITTTIRSWRQGLQIGLDTSVYLHRKTPTETNYMEIRICTDRARPSRPVLVCKNLHVMQKLDHQVRAGQPIVWMDLIRDGLVEYLDKCEEADFDIVIATDLYQALNCKASTKDKKGMAYTHVEIHGLAVCGISSGLIPLTNFNQGPRNTYGSAMSRQAMAASSTSTSKHRMDLSGVQFWYAQVPLAKTVLSSVLGFDILPNGQNHDIMILTTGKEAQEDAQIDDLTCHDRGLSRVSISRTITVSASNIVLENTTNEMTELELALTSKRKMTAAEKAKFAKSIVPGQEIFKKMNPEQTLRPKLADYSQIEDADGLICAGKLVGADTVIAQRVSKIPPVMIPGGTIDAHGIDAPIKVITEKDNAEIVKSFSSAIISKVAICNDNKGDVVSKIGIIQNRRMEEGDKQANRHGQKGTLGRLCQQEDMPFDRFGGSPVTILSSLAFPSRMLWADVMEKLLNLAASCLGIRADATPFSNGYRAMIAKLIDEKMAKDGQPHNEGEDEFLKRYSERGFTKEFSDETEEEIQERVSSVLYRALAALGLHPTGEKTMYSGETGKKLNGRMFSSSSYKLILRHIAGWKLRSRQEGERDRLTQQPVSGKNRNGGLKVNVMERDALLASGATEVVHNLLVVCSDPAFMVVCRECNCNCIYGNVSQRTYCKICDKYDTGLKVSTSAGTVLTQQEMGAVGINLQILVAPI